MTGIEIALSKITKSLAKSSLNKVLSNNKTTKQKKKIIPQDILDEALEETEDELFLLNMKRKMERLKRDRLNLDLLQAQNNYHHSQATLTVANKKSNKSKKRKKSKKGKK